MALQACMAATCQGSRAQAQVPRSAAVEGSPQAAVGPQGGRRLERGLAGQLGSTGWQRPVVKGR